MIGLGRILKRLAKAQLAAERKLRHAQTHPASSPQDDAFAAAVDDGDQARDRQDWAAAADGYQRAVSIRPDRDILVQRAHMLKESGDLETAGQTYEEALRLKPDDADLMVQMGHYHWVAGRAEASLDYYRRAAAAAPDQPDIAQHVAVGLSRLEPPVDHRPRDEAMAAMQARRWPEAERLFQDMVDHTPDLRILLAHVIKEQGRLDEAITHYRIYYDGLAPEPSSERIEGAFQLAHALKQSGRLSQSALYFNQARFERSAYEGWVGSVDVWLEEIQDCVSRVHPAIDTAAMRGRGP